MRVRTLSALFVSVDVPGHWRARRRSAGEHRRRRRRRLHRAPHSTAAERPGARSCRPAPAPITVAHPRTSPTTGPVYETTATGASRPLRSRRQPRRRQLAAAHRRQPRRDRRRRQARAAGAGLAGPLRGRARRGADVGARRRSRQIIWAGNQIIGLPYIYGGGHESFISPGYDCSGTVSFALHGAGLLTTPEDSSEFEAWGSHGTGRWVTIFSNPGHAYMTVAGLRLDTSAADDPSNQQGPRWRPLRAATAATRSATRSGSERSRPRRRLRLRRCWPISIGRPVNSQ